MPIVWSERSPAGQFQQGRCGFRSATWWSRPDCMGKIVDYVYKKYLPHQSSEFLKGGDAWVTQESLRPPKQMVVGLSSARCQQEGTSFTECSRSGTGVHGSWLTGFATR